jgi:hypothetical protein
MATNDTNWQKDLATTKPAGTLKYYSMGNSGEYPLRPLKTAQNKHPRYVNVFPTNANAEVITSLSDYEQVWTDFLGIILRGPLYLQEAPQINASSRYEEPYSGMNLKAWQLAADTVTFATGKNVRFDALAVTGFRSFSGSEPLRVTVTFKFYMGMWGYYDGCYEVYNPIAFLTQLCLPMSANGVLISPGPNSYTGFAEVVKTFTGLAKAMSSAVFSDTALSMVDSIIQKGATAIDSVAQTLAKKMSANRGVYTLRIGSMYYSNLFCEAAEPQFSPVVDDNGYPVWGTVRMTFSSMFSAQAGSIPIHEPSDAGSVNVPSDATRAR